MNDTATSVWGFDLHERVGGGGMGAVFRATDRDTRRIKIKALPIALVAVCAAAACSAASPGTARREAPPPTTAVSVDEVPGSLAARMTSSTQIADSDGDRVVVAGRYIQVDVRKRGAPTDEPVYRGHVAIELDDGHAIFLEPTWSETAIRSPSEIAAHEGKRVEAAGTLHARCPSPPEPAAAIISPCLVEVEFVRPLDTPLRETTKRRPTVQANQGELKRCYKRALRYEGPGIGGRIVLKVSPRQTPPNDVIVVDDQTGSHSLADCIVRVLRAATLYDSETQGPFEVPLVFQSDCDTPGCR